MTALFDPITVRGVTIPNRIVKSAMAEGACDHEGRPLPALADQYERWARGGVGLAITGMAHIRPGFSFTGREIGLYHDSLIRPLREVTEVVHAHGGCVFAQICHAPPQLPRATARRLGAVAPSPGFDRTNLLRNRALTDAELRALVADFGAAARRARQAGFDGVQLHAAHGYLLSRMLSPLHNRRDDRWGGDFERRLEFLHQVVQAVRGEVGDDYPVTAKLNAHDGLPGGRGLQVDDGVEIARRMEAWSIDAIEVSAGTGDVGLGSYPNRGGLPPDLSKRFLVENFPFLRPLGPALGAVVILANRGLKAPASPWFEDLARRFAEALTIPVMCVGGIRSRTDAERILTESRVAMVSLGRPLVRQPDLPQRWKEGADAAACTSCNRCFVEIGLGRPLACTAEASATSPRPRSWAHR